MTTKTAKTSKVKRPKTAGAGTKRTEASLPTAPVVASQPAHGGTQVDVQDVIAEAERIEIRPDSGDPGPPGASAPGKVIGPPLEQAQQFILQKGFDALGNAVAGITNMPALAFTHGESSTLAEVWAPFMPQDLPPVYGAIIATIAIVGGKVGIYYGQRKAG